MRAESSPASSATRSNSSASLVSGVPTDLNPRARNSGLTRHFSEVVGVQLGVGGGT